MGRDKESRAVMNSIYKWLDAAQVLSDADEKGTLAGALSHIYYSSKRFQRFIKRLVNMLAADEEEKEKIGDLIIELQTELKDISWEIKESRHLLEKVLDTIFE